MNLTGSFHIPRYKDEIEKIQEMSLAPYATKRPKENSRRYVGKGYNAETRSEFQRDRDRIIHSKAFRRLLYKTQVFVNHEGDHYRTRMTHSLEVAQISRGIARSLAANEDLAEAIALGHDLGHTPFGHAVETLLARKLKDEHGFYHNEQSVRIVDIIEKKPEIEQGLNLTWEVREGILKHTRDRTEGIYDSLLPAMPSGIEGQIVGLADTVAYVCHDLDDGINAGLIQNKIKNKLLTDSDLKDLWSKFDLKYEEGIGVSSIINKLVTDIVDTSWEIIRTYNIDSADKVRCFKESQDKPVEYSRIIRLGKYRDAFLKLKEFVTENIYKSSMTSIMDVKAEKFIEKIYDTYWENPEQLPDEIYHKFVEASKTKENAGISSGEGSSYDGYVTTPARVLCDYIASMTDRFALETYEKLFNPYTKI
ncbi:MAG: dNTP triphosphohydrolase [Clostridia bacterium]|nr:dNTP triphosphohydrolase [Clostridia bacterium]